MRGTLGAAAAIGLWLAVAPAAAAAAAASGPPAAAGPEEATVVYLVRHAEAVYPPPAAAPRDPPLNAAGRERAAELARLLADAGIGRIFTTDLHRTRETAAPLAARLGLAPELYDPGALAALAATLRATPGRFLVSGHSNTTPELVRLLGGEPGAPIDEQTEFDRLYAVVLQPGRPAVTLRLRYGPPPVPWPPAER